MPVLRPRLPSIERARHTGALPSLPVAGMTAGVAHKRVLVGQREGEFADTPAYQYVLDSDNLRSYLERDPLVRVKLFDPAGRFTYFVTGYTDDNGHRYLTGYCVSPLGADCDELGDLGADEVESLRNRFGLPLERDLHFKPMRQSELLERLSRGEHV